MEGFFHLWLLQLFFLFFFIFFLGRFQRSLRPCQFPQTWRLWLPVAWMPVLESLRMQGCVTSQRFPSFIWLILTGRSRLGSFFCFPPPYPLLTWILAPLSPAIVVKQQDLKSEGATPAAVTLAEKLSGCGKGPGVWVVEGGVEPGDRVTRGSQPGNGWSKHFLAWNLAAHSSFSILRRDSSFRLRMASWTLFPLSFWLSLFCFVVTGSSKDFVLLFSSTDHGGSRLWGRVEAQGVKNTNKQQTNKQTNKSRNLGALWRRWQTWGQT